MSATQKLTGEMVICGDNGFGRRIKLNDDAIITFEEDDIIRMKTVGRGREKRPNIKNGYFYNCILENDFTIKIDKHTDDKNRYFVASCTVQLANTKDVKPVSSFTNTETKVNQTNPTQYNSYSNYTPTQCVNNMCSSTPVQYICNAGSAYNNICYAIPSIPRATIDLNSNSFDTRLRDNSDLYLQAQMMQFELPHNRPTMMLTGHDFSALRGTFGGMVGPTF